MTRNTHPSLRSALLDRLKAEWVPANAHGYDLSTDTEYGSSTRLHGHLGEYDDGVPDPQLTIQGVDSVEAGGGASGIKGDGTGSVQLFDNRLQVDVWVEGSIGDDPDLMAVDIANEAAEIVHAIETTFVDPETGELLAEQILPLGEPVAIAEPEASLTEWRAMFEVGVETRRDPPER